MENTSAVIADAEWTEEPDVPLDEDIQLLGASQISGILTAETVKALEVSGALLGIITNIKVILVILMNRYMLKTRTNLFIFWQSVVDFLSGLFQILITQISIQGKQYDRNSFSDLLFCFLYVSRLPYYTFFGASTFNMVAMTTERYLAVVRPIWHKLHISNKVVYISMPLSLLYGFTYQAVLKFPSTNVIEGRCRMNQWPDLRTKRMMAMVSPVAVYILPVAIVLMTYGHMAYKLHQGVREGSQLSSGAARARRNVIITMVMIIAGYIICRTSGMVQFLLFNLGYKIDMNSDVFRLGRVMSLLGSTINPFIYMVQYKPYQTAMRRCIWRISCGKLNWAKVEDSSSGTTSIHTT